MNDSLENLLENMTAHRESRQELADTVLENRQWIPELLAIGFTVSNKNAHKACWVLELVFLDNIESLLPHLEFFCNNLQQISHESALRPVSKIIMLLMNADYKHHYSITNNQKQILAEACMDWLISDSKVATKCYSIRALYVLGYTFQWIHPELKIILDQNYHQQSAAYKAVTREVLKKIK
jgi:hypothetical protein